MKLAEVTGVNPNFTLFDLEHAAPILAKHDDWNLLRRFVYCLATTDLSVTLKLKKSRDSFLAQFVANPKVFEKQ